MRCYRVCLSCFHCANRQHQCTRETESGMSIARLTSVSSGIIYFHVRATSSVSSSHPGEFISMVFLTSSSHWSIWSVWHHQCHQSSGRISTSIIKKVFLNWLNNSILFAVSFNTFFFSFSLTACDPGFNSPERLFFTLIYFYYYYWNKILFSSCGVGGVF